MTDTSKYKFVGISRRQGVLNVRYANSAGRHKVLVGAGHTDVRFVELELAGRVEDCVDALLNEGWIKNNAEYYSVACFEAERLGFVI